MQKKSNISTALWFIPLLAILLAMAFVFLYWVGRTLLQKNSPLNRQIKTRDVSEETVEKSVEPSPVLPPASVDEELESEVPPEVLELTQLQEEKSAQSESEVCPATTVSVKLNKPKRSIPHTPYEKGLRRCKQNNVFPCAWEDREADQIKQYWLMGKEGPITRGIYDLDGNLLKETIATVNGTVSTHTEHNTTWYFQAGTLIKIRTSPYDNCNFHDWFFINEFGEQDVCQCAYTTANCCARSPYQNGQDRNYCALFPQDKEFCK